MTKRLRVVSFYSLSLHNYWNSLPKMMRTISTFQYIICLACLCSCLLITLEFVWQTHKRLNNDLYLTVLNGLILKIRCFMFGNDKCNPVVLVSSSHFTDDWRKHFHHALDSSSCVVNYVFILLSNQGFKTLPFELVSCCTYNSIIWISEVIFCFPTGRLSSV